MIIMYLIYSNYGFILKSYVSVTVLGLFIHKSKVSLRHQNFSQLASERLLVYPYY